MSVKLGTLCAVRAAVPSVAPLTAATTLDTFPRADDEDALVGEDEGGTGRLMAPRPPLAVPLWSAALPSWLPSLSSSELDESWRRSAEAEDAEAEDAAGVVADAV